jgi:transcriptional regulator with XRE-family HTH domain
MKNVLSTLEAQRKAMGLTYKALAIKAGLMPDTVRGILQGWQSPKFETLRILADTLDVELGVTARVVNN